MFRVLFCLMAVIIGGFALFFGSESVIGYDWTKSGEDFRYADPPVIQIKNTNKIKKETTQIPNTSEFIFCYTYDEFKRITSEMEDENLEFDLKESNNFGNPVVLYAKAESQNYKIIYEPTLLLAISDYGSDDLISELEIENDKTYLRIINPFEEYAEFLSDSFRRKKLPYAINNKGLDEMELEEALKKNAFPKYSITITGNPIDFPVSLSYEEIQLKMKGMIYDSVIKAYQSGYEMLVFKANIKNLKCLQTTLKEMLPLPVKLISYPYWRDSL